MIKLSPVVGAHVDDALGGSDLASELLDHARRCAGDAARLLRRIVALQVSAQKLHQRLYRDSAVDRFNFVAPRQCRHQAVEGEAFARRFGEAPGYLVPEIKSIVVPAGFEVFLAQKLARRFHHQKR